MKMVFLELYRVLSEHGVGRRGIKYRAGDWEIEDENEIMGGRQVSSEDQFAR
jgi:hypothetical protein